IGDRDMQLVGVDPLASSELGPAGGERSTPGGPSGATVLGRPEWFTRPGAVVMAAGPASQLGLREGQGFELDVGGVRHPAVLISQIPQSAAYDSLVLTDIAQAQEWLGMVGKLTRIEVKMPTGPDGDILLARLRERVPPDAQLHEAQGRTRESLDMTGAFTTNLKAMSLLALLVSTLLIYGAISFAVV